jgi:molecular chaperone DnaK
MHTDDDERPTGMAGQGVQGAGAGPSGQDRRRFPRIQLALTVELRFPTAEAALESRTVDISEGGVFIRMRQPRPEGTAIQLRLHVGGRVLEIGGVVVRCVRPDEGEPPGIGVLFTELRPDDAAFMKSLVSERLSR